MAAPSRSIEPANGRRATLWACAAAAGVIMAAAAGAEHLLGRRLWGISGRPGLWSGSVQSEHNSQYLFDPYTLSHVSHGIIWYGVMWLVGRTLPVRVRIVIAIAIEAVWEVVENTDVVIHRYRAATISLHYFGDSIMNSMDDIVACAAGLIVASVLPARVSILLLVLLELLLAFWIRDNIALNILMLLHPIRAIQMWQTGA
jgi:hypothetical protein